MIRSKKIQIHYKIEYNILTSNKININHVKMKKVFEFFKHLLIFNEKY